MNFSGWFVKIKTDVGTLELPFGSPKGYRTRKEADFVASEAMRVTPGIISAEVKQYKDKK